MARIWWIPLIAAACTPAGGVRTPASGSGPAAPAILAWDRASAPARYEVADTSALTMDIPGMGEAPVNLSSRAVVDMTFREGPTGLVATATVTDIEGRFASPAGAPTIVTAEDRPPPATLQVAPDGAVRLDDVAPFEGGLAQVTAPTNLYRVLFPMLPARAAEVGAMWTDTVHISETQTGMTSRTTQIIQSTWARDTVMGGRTLMVIESLSTTQIEISGLNQGVEVEQALSGTSSGFSLWDPQARQLVERHVVGTASGSASLPGLGMSDIAVTARTGQHVRMVSR